jgi:hypothetical protein
MEEEMQMKYRKQDILMSQIIQILLVYGINSFHSIYWCALFFSFLTLHTLYVADKATIKTAFCITSVSILINLGMSINNIYYIQGQPIKALYLASYLSMFVSLSLGLVFFAKMKTRLSIPGRYFSTSFLVSFIDGLGMMLFFIPIYKIERVFQIFAKEVSYKVFFAAIVLGAIYMVRGSITKLKQAST